MGEKFDKALEDLHQVFQEIDDLIDHESDTYTPQSGEEFMARADLLWEKLNKKGEPFLRLTGDKEIACMSIINQITEYQGFLDAMFSLREDIKAAPFKKQSKEPRNQFLVQRYKNSMKEIDHLAHQYQHFKYGRTTLPDEYGKSLALTAKNTGEGFATLLKTEGFKYIYESGFVQMEVYKNLLIRQMQTDYLARPLEEFVATPDESNQKPLATVTILEGSTLPTNKLNKLMAFQNALTLLCLDFKAYTKGEKDIHPDILVQKMETLNERFNALKEAGIPIDGKTREMLEHETGINALLKLSELDNP